MSATKDWLAPYTWEFVTAQNALLCEAKDTLHEATSDGHASTKQLWQENHPEPMSLAEAVELCRRCHELAPFCFYNGNTFAAIIRDAVGILNLSPEHGYLARSLAGHIVAGVASPEETQQFQDFCQSLDPSIFRDIPPS